MSGPRPPNRWDASNLVFNDLTVNTADDDEQTVPDIAMDGAGRPSGCTRRWARRSQCSNWR